MSFLSHQSISRRSFLGLILSGMVHAEWVTIETSSPIYRNDLTARVRPLVKMRLIRRVCSAEANYKRLMKW